MSKVLDLETAKRLLQEAVEAHPGRVNPKAERFTGCVYTSKNGKSHCIAGQVLVDFGFSVPKWGEFKNNESIDTLVNDDAGLPVTPEALRYLQAAQYVFDGCYIKNVGGGPDTSRRWHSAYKLLESRYDQVLEDMV